MSVDWEKIAGYVVVAAGALGAVKIIVNELGWKAKELKELKDRLDKLESDIEKESEERKEDVRDLDRFIRLK